MIILRVIIEFILKIFSSARVPRLPKGEPKRDPVMFKDNAELELVNEKTDVILDIASAPAGPTWRDRAVQRALEIAATHPTVYKLGAGGRNPNAKTPFTIRDGVFGADCIGFVLWCLGIDRFQKTFPYYGGWINTDSAMMDAAGKQAFFEHVTVPRPGDLVIFPSLRKDGKMTRMGHVGIITDVPADWPADWQWSRSDRKAWLAKLTMIDCNASKARRLKKRAVGADPVSINWNKPDAVFVRLKKR